MTARLSHIVIFLNGGKKDLTQQKLATKIDLPHFSTFLPNWDKKWSR